MPKRMLATMMIVLTSFLGSTQVVAEKNFAVKVGAGYSDNIGKVETNPQGETIATAGIDFAIVQDSRRWSINAASDLEYLRYQTSRYNGLVGNLTGLADIKLLPERFDWIFQDNFGQVLSDPFAPASPDNRQNINYFATGPDLKLGFGRTNKAVLSGRYAVVNYHDAATSGSVIGYVNNNRVSAALGLLHELSSVSQVSLNLQSEKVDFAGDSSAIDYDQQQAFVRYDLKGSRTRLTTDAGYAAINRTNADDNGYLVRVSVERKMTPIATLSLHLGHEFSDASSSFRFQQELQSTGLQPQSTTQTSNPFVNEYVDLQWQLAGQRTSVGVGASYFDASYEKQPQSDQSRWVGSLSISRTLTPSLQLLFTSNYSKAEPKQATGTNASYRELDSSLGLAWQFSQHLSCSLEYDRYDRNSDASNGDYQENRGWLKFRYGVVRR